MKHEAIILDLDDTLISTHKRQYSCIRDYLTNYGKWFISFDEYVQLRRSSSLSNTNMLKSLQLDLDWEVFRSYYLEQIESQKYLALDELIIEKDLLAAAVQKGFKLILLSLRGNSENSKQQLLNLGIKRFLEATYFEKHDLNSNPKLLRLQQLNGEFEIVSFCSDSVADCEAAHQLNINFVQVKTSLYRLPDFEKATSFDNINQYFSSIL